ncbi:ribonuclease H-like domain-containing protein [Tanacetum coccineum]
MEFESAQSNTTAKLPILKLGEYEMWVIRIKQYFQVQDYALWEVIENGNSWVFVPQTTQENDTSVTKMSVPVTTEEKTNKKNDVKARSLLLMAPEDFSIVSPNVNTASPQVSTASFSDNAVYAFMLSLLSMRAKRYFQRTSKKIFINANDTVGNQDNTRKQGNNEDTSSKAMLAIDGVGFDWSDMAEEQVQTNMALMAFSDSEVYNDKACSKTCLKNYETLKKQCDDLIVKLNQTKFTAATYKRVLETVEEQLITYRKNEVLFSEEVAVLKKEVACKDYEINMLKTSKDLEKLLESPITEKSKKGLGYNVVPPPHPLIYNRPKKLDLSYFSLDEFKDPEFKSYGSEDSKQKSNIVCDKKSDNSKENSDDTLVKEQVSEDTSSFVKSLLNVDKETVFLDKKIECVKPKNHEKLVKKSVSLASFGGDKPQQNDTGFIDSGCSRHMTRNIAYLSDFKEFDGGYVTFRGGAHGGRISGKGTLKTDRLDFEDAYFINELKFNLFSILLKGVKIQLLAMYRITSSTFKLPSNNSFKLPDESQILLKIPRKDNMYSFEMKNIVPKETLTCLVVNATSDESMLWHRRLGHINFKNINKLVKDNLVRVVTDDYSRLYLVFFLTTKDETSEILKNFIKEIENLLDKKVKIIRSDNGTEFKNKNGVAERRNRTLIEAARTMLADSKLPTTFWAEAVSTACYVQNRVLVVKPHNKTPYELFRGFKPALSFMRPFGCHVTILNTLDNLGKFDGKSDEGFFVGYSLSSKAFRVYNTRTRRVEENLHIGFLENKPMIEGNGPKWLFDIDSLTQSMNYVPVAAGTITNESAGTQGELNADCEVPLTFCSFNYPVRIADYISTFKLSG